MDAHTLTNKRSMILCYSCLVRVREAFLNWIKRGRYTTEYVMPQQICVMFNVIAQAKKQVRFRLWNKHFSIDISKQKESLRRLNPTHHTEEHSSHFKTSLCF